MCETCSSCSLAGTRYGRGGVACTIDGVPASRALSRPCPRGRHPDRQNVVRWMGVRWYGVPMPLRIWLRIAHPRHPRIFRWDGCGCVVVLKRGIETIGLVLRMMTLPTSARLNTEQGLQEIGHG